MKYFSISRLEDKSFVNIHNNIVLIFKNINHYEEEVYSLLESNKISLVELEELVVSWGGAIETLILEDLVKKHVKESKKNVEDR